MMLTRTKLSRRGGGFTLVELMLAISFVGILLITMLVAIIHVTGLYSKGMTIKSINQAGRDLGASIKRDATGLMSVANPIVQPDEAGAGSLGRLCLGSYSYIWSPAAKISDGSATHYVDATDAPIILARVADSGGGYCQQLATGQYRMDVMKAQATEMLPVEGGDYALHAALAQRIPATGATSASEVLYDIRYTIGTNDNGSISTTDQSCKAPDDAQNNFNFCSVNTFEIMVRAG